MKCQHCVDLKEAFADLLDARHVDHEPDEWTPEHEAQHKESCIKLADVLKGLEDTRPLLESLPEDHLSLESLDKAVAILQGMRTVAQKHGAWPEEADMSDT